MPGIPWTKNDLKLAVDIVRRSSTVFEAAKAVSAALGREITSPALFNKLQREGFEIGANLGTADPIAVHEQREAKQRARADVSSMVEEVRELRKRQAFLDEVSQRAAPVVPQREKSNRVREMTAVVLASDWHVEETVDPESIANRNKYNLDIAANRIDRFFQAIVWNFEHQRASGKIALRDLVLWLGGDLISGYIHEELMEGNALSPTETVLWLAPRLEGGLRHLLKMLQPESIIVPCSFGNHGRTTMKPRVATGYSNSFEWLMYHQLAALLKEEKRVRFEITSSGHQYVHVYDKTIHFHHGDDLKYGGGVGGLGIPLLKAVPQWDLVRRADIHCIGHFHTLRDFGRAVVNGSLIGYGPYSQRIRAEFEPPQQAMFYVDSKRGKTMLTHLWVAEREEVNAKSF